MALITDTRIHLPIGLKITLWSGLAVSSVGAIFYAFKRRKKVIWESALFFTFLVIGGGIGLTAQVFDLPVHAPAGLIGWAVLSLILVLMSERELLSLLWFPLFLGGILGYVRLEFLFLFLAQAPVATTCLSATILGTCIYATRHAHIPFLRALNHWCIALYFLVLLLGENGIAHPITAFVVTVGFLSLLAGYAVRTAQPILFNLTLGVLAVRLVFLTADRAHLSEYGALWTLMCGGVIILSAVLYRFLTNRRADRP